MDWYDLLAVQGTLKSPLQNHSSLGGTLRGMFDWGESSCFVSPMSGVTLKVKYMGASGLSAARSQHHLPGYEIAQLEFYHLH